MTNKYLAKLHSLERGSSPGIFKTRDPEPPTKLPKLGFDGFGSDYGCRVFENGKDLAEVDPCANGMVENEKGGTPPNRQNCQNPRSPSVPTAPAEPSLAYQAVSADASGATCRVQIVELPQAQRYRKTFALLQTKCPALIPVERWRQCVEDGSKFLAVWGEQAEALGWTSADLFGLHTPPANPHPSYSRLSRYNCTGLCWLLQSRKVLALTEATATILNPATGAITTYRRFNKPALGPLGDSLEDLQ
jgi:hypothetical protein